MKQLTSLITIASISLLSSMNAFASQCREVGRTVEKYRIHSTSVVLTPLQFTTRTNLKRFQKCSQSIIQAQQEECLALITATPSIKLENLKSGDIKTVDTVIIEDGKMRMLVFPESPELSSQHLALGNVSLRDIQAAKVKAMKTLAVKIKQELMTFNPEVLPLSSDSKTSVKVPVRLQNSENLKLQFVTLECAYQGRQTIFQDKGWSIAQ